MAIVQISRIQHRKGLQENLPQLAGAELGWAQDTRRLYIGNGTLVDGAPVIGNTEILTEHSNLLEVSTSYTYKGSAGGYIVTTDDPAVERTLNEKLDDFASVKDFGAKGDGATDDTEAINRALYELFSRQKNPQVRRSLFFPAGVYKTSDTILVPPYAKIYGEGAESSIIRLQADDSSVAPFVVRTTDSLQQIGANIGSNSAIIPQNIEVSSMSFESTAESHILLLESAQQCYFDSVNFSGPADTTTVSDASLGTVAIEVQGTPAAIPEMVTFDKCRISGCTYGLHTDAESRAITFSNGQFDLLWRAVQLGESSTGTGPAGYRIVQNLFNNIADSAVYFNNSSKNISAFNVFLDCANTFNGLGNPAESVIQILSSDNVSVGDQFERNDDDDKIHSRIDIAPTVSALATVNGTSQLVGRYTRDAGLQQVLDNNQVAPAKVFTEEQSSYQGFKIDYSIRRGDTRRIGTITATLSEGANPLSYYDDYTENAQTGILLSVTELGATFSLEYTSTNTVDGLINYSISHLR